MTLRTNQRVTSPAGYVGGKCRLAPHIIKRLPTERQCFVEVFGGMGHVMSQKAPEANEVFNDVQSIIVTFFLVLRDHTDELVKRIERMPYSREEHDRIQDWWESGCPGPVTDIERSARWLYLLRTSISSNLGGDFGYSRLAQSPRPITMSNMAARLESIACRWRGVQVEHLDFGDIIPRYDAPGTVFFCDPPYVGVEQYYPGSGFSELDHARLAGTLEAIEGRAIVTYYDDPLIEQLYPKSRWRRSRVGVVKSSCAITRGGASTRPRATELILTNYDPSTGRRLDDRRRARSRK